MIARLEAPTERFDDLVVVSDLHLWDVGERRYAEAVRFFRELPREVDGLVVLGDLFDFWMGRNARLARRFEAVLAALRGLAARGVRILYCEGNHDLHLARPFGDDLGLTTFVGERVVEAAGRVVHLAHGDLVNPHDHGYLFLRWLLRTPLVRALVRIAPAWVPIAIGERSSRASRAYTARKDDPLRELSHVWADARIAAGADVVVIGHTHLPERTERRVAGGRTGVYLNTGLWEADGTRRWARIDAQGVALHEARGETGER